MKTYIFKVTTNSTVRGYNRTVDVYRVKNNRPVFIGYNAEISTASYKGDYAIACQIVHDRTGAKLKPGGYDLLSKNIQIFQV